MQLYDAKFSFYYALLLSSKNDNHRTAKVFYTTEIHCSMVEKNSISSINQSIRTRRQNVNMEAQPTNKLLKVKVDGGKFGENNGKFSIENLL